ncbi:MAG: hypothetical protein Q8P26_01645 [Candidatus Levybacteria bacterium]|nr:hypothetical protein [Candidatus Levybacteria bacterium]
MFLKLYKHSAYYIFLAGILTVGFLLITTSGSSRSFQIGSVIATTFFYVIWGIIHHLINHDLNVKIVVEYILIGIFGLTIIYFLLAINGNY